MFPNNQTVLGIDIGTSSVKCSMVQIESQESFQILSSGKCSYDLVRINRSKNPSYSQQSVEEIFESIKQAIRIAQVSSFQVKYRAYLLLTIVIFRKLCNDARVVLFMMSCIYIFKLNLFFYYYFLD